MTLMLLAVAWLLTYVVHSTLLLAGAWSLTRLRIVRAHDSLDILWKVALLGGILTATAQVALSLRPATGLVALRPVVESPSVEALASGPLLVSAPAAPAALAEAERGSDIAPVLAASSAAEPRVLGSFHAGWPGLVLNLWLFGALACGFSLFWARAEMRRRLGDRRAVTGPLAVMLEELVRETGVRRDVRLTMSATIAGPVAFGRSEICLPERVATDLGPEEQRAVLAHELGHLVRRDPAWQLAAAVIAAALFVQPLNRLARRRLQELAEYLCDDWAAARSGGGLVMARCLAEVAQWMRPAPELAVAPALAARPSQLVARVERLLAGGTAAHGRRRAVALLGAGALGLVAWTAPGVAARDLPEPAAPVAEEPDGKTEHEGWAATAASGGDGWLSVREEGRLLVLHPRYSVRLTGQGRLGFRQWGRVLALADGYHVTVDGAPVSGDADVCEEQDVRIVGPDGAVAWTLAPLRLPARASSLAAARRRVHDGDPRAEAELDAALDTLVRAWAHDPEAVRVAAERLARTFETDLAPRFESLGVALGRELEPGLERLSDRLGRDLGPEFARLGAELGRSLAGALLESDLRHSVEPGAGSGDYRDKRRPKR